VRQLLRAKIVGPEAHIAVVLDSESSRTSKIGESALRAETNIVDDRVGWSDLAVAVVPGEFCQFEDVERGFGVLTEEVLDGGLTLSSPVGSTRRHGHGRILPESSKNGTTGSTVAGQA
jgi:hypothetical protein